MTDRRFAAEAPFDETILVESGGFSTEGPYSVALIFDRRPPDTELRIDFIGTSEPLANNGAVSGAYWGFRLDRRPLVPYGRIGRGISLGTIEVPILAAALYHRPGRLDVFSTDIVSITFPWSARVKGAFVTRRDWSEFRDERRAPGVVDRLLGLVGVGR